MAGRFCFRRSRTGPRPTVTGPPGLAYCVIFRLGHGHILHRLSEEWRTLRLVPGERAFRSPRGLGHRYSAVIGDSQNEIDLRQRSGRIRRMLNLAAITTPPRCLQSSFCKASASRIGVRNRLFADISEKLAHPGGTRLKRPLGRRPKAGLDPLQPAKRESWPNQTLQASAFWQSNYTVAPSGGQECASCVLVSLSSQAFQRSLNPSHARFRRSTAEFLSGTTATCPAWPLASDKGRWITPTNPRLSAPAQRRGLRSRGRSRARRAGGIGPASEPTGAWRLRRRDREALGADGRASGDRAAMKAVGACQMIDEEVRAATAYFSNANIAEAGDCLDRISSYSSR